MGQNSNYNNSKKEKEKVGLYILPPLLKEFRSQNCEAYPSITVPIQLSLKLRNTINNFQTNTGKALSHVILSFPSKVLSRCVTPRNLHQWYDLGPQSFHVGD